MTLCSTEESQQEKVPPGETINLILAGGLAKISFFNILLHEIPRLVLQVTSQTKISSTQFKGALIHRQVWIIKCDITKIFLDG